VSPPSSRAPCAPCDSCDSVGFSKCMAPGSLIGERQGVSPPISRAPCDSCDSVGFANCMAPGSLIGERQGVSPPSSRAPCDSCDFGGFSKCMAPGSLIGERQGVSPPISRAPCDSCNSVNPVSMTPRHIVIPWCSLSAWHRVLVPVQPFYSSFSFRVQATGNPSTAVFKIRQKRITANRA
jgi:hypothetical protein